MSAPTTGRGAAILDDLAARGLVHDTTDPDLLRARLDDGPIVVYGGFDPTADSLHIGSLVPLLLLRRFQLFGHRPIALAGGATGMIGDPSGRSDERNLLDGPTLDRYVAGIKAQLEQFLDFSPGPTQAELVDNREWTEPVSILEFLRDVGKHITVNVMLAKESVQARVESESGISYTEFSYMLLQANDYRWLHRHRQCELQVGGSDQWGNITAGIDLVRRTSGHHVHGLTVPLVTKADGTKFGKSVEGAVWLDPARTSPYAFYQYFVNSDDRDVRRFLLQLTLLPVDEVDRIMEVHDKAPERREAQRALAGAVTALVHGEAAAIEAQAASSGFTRASADLSADDLGCPRRRHPHHPPRPRSVRGARPDRRRRRDRAGGFEERGPAHARPGRSLRQRRAAEPDPPARCRRPAARAVRDAASREEEPASAGCRTRRRCLSTGGNPGIGENARVRGLAPCGWRWYGASPCLRDRSYRRAAGFAGLTRPGIISRLTIRFGTGFALHRSQHCGSLRRPLAHEGRRALACRPSRQGAP